MAVCQEVLAVSCVWCVALMIQRFQDLAEQIHHDLWLVQVAFIADVAFAVVDRAAIQDRLVVAPCDIETLAWSHDVMEILAAIYATEQTGKPPQPDLANLARKPIL